MNIQELIKKIENNYEHVEEKEKVFYSFDEWDGWAFYKKAIKNKDWKSIIGHIKSKLKDLFYFEDKQPN